MTTGAVAGLSLLAVGLSTAIAAELFGRGGGAAGLAVSSTVVLNEAVRERGPPLAHAADSRVREILSRPIFSPGRRPVGATAHSVAGLSRLTGIIVAGNRKVAIFAPAAPGGPPVLAEEGSRVNAYQVTAISQSGVTVVGPDGPMVVAPIFDRAPPTAPASLAVAPPESSRQPKK